MARFAWMNPMDSQFAAPADWMAGAVFPFAGNTTPETGTIPPGSTIVGGAINGTIVTNGATLDGLTRGAISIRENALVRVDDGSALTVEGAIAGSDYGGAIMLDGTLSGATLAIDGIVRIGTTLVLSDNTSNLIEGSTSNARLSITRSLTGAGTIGNGKLTLLNSGYIEATGVNALVINNTGVLNNSQALIGVGAGGLDITSSVFTNTGVIEAMSGSSVTIAPGLFTNLAAGTLTDGFYEAIATTGSTASLAFRGAITTDAAKDIILSGKGASITANGSTLGSTLATIAAGAGLALENGARLNTHGTFTDNGYLDLYPGTLTGSALTISSSGFVFGGNVGTAKLAFTGSVVNDGTIMAYYGNKLVISAAQFTNAGVVTVLGNEGKASDVIIDAARVTNLAAGTLTGGVWSTGSNEEASGRIDIQNGVITTDATVIDLYRGGIFTSGGRDIQSSLTSVAAGGQLNLESRISFYSPTAAIIDSGTISLGFGHFASNGLTIAAGGLFIGTGDLVGPIVDDGTLEAAGSRTLLLNASVTGTGLLAASGGASLNPAYGYSVGSITVGLGSTLFGAGTAAGAIDISGQLAMRGGTLSGGSITIFGADGKYGLLSGSGTVGQHVASTGTISAYAGTLTLAAGETGGVLKVQTNSSLVSTGGAVAKVTALAILAAGTFTGYGGVTGITGDSGTLIAAGGNLSLATETGSGAAAISAAATLTVAAPATFGAGIAFDPAGTATLALGTPAGNTAILTGFAATDTIDLLHTTITAATYSQVTHLLTLSEGTTTQGTLGFAGTYAAAAFILHADGAGGTDISYAAAPANPFTDVRHATASAMATAAPPAYPRDISPSNVPPAWSAAYAEPAAVQVSDLILHHL